MGNPIIFGNAEIRNKFIKKFDNSFSNAEIGRIVGLTRETVRTIKPGLKIKKRREYISITCPGCKEDRMIRKDGFKNSPKGYCRSCSHIYTPKNQKLAEKLNMNCISCGKEISVKRRSWIRGTKKCNPCRTKETSKIEYGLSSKKTLYAQYKATAKKKKIKFELYFDQFIEITSNNCFYCGVNPKALKKSWSDNGDYIYNGIDRVNNKKGYVTENVVSCCKTCNYSKNTMEVQCFYNWIKLIYNNLEKRGVFDE